MSVFVVYCYKLLLVPMLCTLTICTIACTYSFFSLDIVSLSNHIVRLASDMDRAFILLKSNEIFHHWKSYLSFSGIVFILADLTIQLYSVLKQSIPKRNIQSEPAYRHARIHNQWSLGVWNCMREVFSNINAKRQFSAVCLGVLVHAPLCLLIRTYFDSINLDPFGETVYVRLMLDLVIGVALIVVHAKMYHS